MKHLFFFLLFSITISAQNNIEATFIVKTPIKIDSLIGIDSFKTLFYTTNNTLIKENSDATLKYSNIQLGNINSANSFNPLKINVFYKAFNTVIILDNRLAEIYKIDFNTIEPYKNITHVSTGSDNTIWLFNQDLQQLELFDYKTNKTRATTLPIESNIIDIASNYNSCWLLTKDFLYEYNYFGSLITKTVNTGYTKIKEDNGRLVLQKENTLFYLDKNSNDFQFISIPNLLINQFLVTNEIVYIYTDEILHQYQLKLQ